MTRQRLLIGGLVLALAILLFFLFQKNPDDATRGSAPTPPNPASAGAPHGDRSGPVAVGPKGYHPKTSRESPHIDTNQSSDHATGIDRRLAQITAMLKATGDGPCDTAYNGTIAERKAAEELGKPSIFEFVAERDEFMKVCESLPEEARQCVAPLYNTRNREKCRALLPPLEVLERMVKLRPEKVVRDDREAAGLPPKEESPPEGPPREPL